MNQAYNPFGELPREAISTVADVDPALFELAKRSGHALLILGDKGHGKSTHLAAIRARVAPDAPYLYLPEVGPAPTYQRSDLGFADELQRAGWFFRRRLFRGATSLVIGSHEDHSAELRRAGFEVTRLVLDQVSPTRVRRMASLRFEAARVTDAAIPRLRPDAEHEIASLFGADLRAAEHALYELAQRRFNLLKQDNHGEV